MANADRNVEFYSRNFPRLAVEVIVGVVGILIAVYAVLDQRANTDRLAQELQSTRTELHKVLAANESLEKVSLEGLLKRYNALVADLKAAADAYEAARATKGSQDAKSQAGAALARAENKLYDAADNFTDFVNKWRMVNMLVSELLDGNATQLDASRREIHADEVDAVAQRIVRSAPNLAEPLRVAIERLQAAPER